MDYVFSGIYSRVKQLPQDFLRAMFYKFNDLK